MIPLLADAGVPMLFLQLPLMLIALVPVIMVETMVARKMLKLDFWPIFKAVITANFVSTLIGFPLLWILLVVVQIVCGGDSSYGLDTFWKRVYAVTIQAPWLAHEDNLGWMIPIAGAYLLIPAFFVSVFLERRICRYFWRNEEKEQIAKFSWKAHFASYTVLIIVAALFYIFAASGI
jgi:hypothetical protein